MDSSTASSFPSSKIPENSFFSHFGHLSSHHVLLSVLQSGQCSDFNLVVVSIENPPPSKVWDLFVETVLLLKKLVVVQTVVRVALVA